MDYIKLAQRTIAMLSSMIESGECHTTRSKEMKDNALNGLEQLRIHDVVRRSELLSAFSWVSSIGEQFFDSSKTVDDMVDAYQKSR